MLSWGWPGSIQRRLSGAELGSFFFEELQLDLQPANLLVEVGRIDRLDRLGAVAFEHDGRLLDQAALPLVNLGGMNLKTLGQLADGLPLLHGLESHSRLERCFTDSSLSSHLRTSLTAVSTGPILSKSPLIFCPASGVHFTSSMVGEF